MLSNGVRAFAAAALFTTVAAGCSSSSSGTASSTPAPSSAAAQTTTPAPATATASATASATATMRPITVLVLNDDGVKAAGIDAVVQALRKEPGVTVKVVAPATNQSGAGGKTSPGTVSYSNSTTISGYPAISVAGTPADSANVAFTQLHLTPDVMISGTNAGQNLGPIVDLSGTVGAARVGARHGVPALAVSSGFAPKIDFATAADYAIKWLRAERPRLPATPSTTASAVVALNVPTCTSGKVRGELKLAQQKTFGKGESVLGSSNCASTAMPTTEVAAFTDGFATLVPLPLDPG